MSFLPISSLAPAAVGLLPVAASAAGGVARGFSQLLKNAATSFNAPVSQSGEAQNSQSRPAQSTKISELKQQQLNLQEQIEQELKQILADNGFNADGPLAFQLDAHNRIKVAGDQAANSEIDQAVATHPELREQFSALAAISGLLNAIEKSQQQPQDANFAANSQHAHRQLAPQRENQNRFQFVLTNAGSAIQFGASDI